MDVTVTRPWLDWPEPRIANGRLASVAVREEGAELAVFVGDQRFGQVTPAGLKELGSRTSTPVDFVQKLSPGLRVQVLNERISTATDRDISLVAEGDEFCSFIPGWRQVATYAEVADAAYDSLVSVYGDVEVKKAQHTNGRSTLRFGVPMQEPVTPAVGDLLQAGIEIDQSYGTRINVSLFMERLRCLNGMRGIDREFSWNQQTAGTVDHQLMWLRDGIQQAMAGYDRVLARARDMANTPINGDIQEALREHARAMRLPNRYWGDLQAAFNEEPGDTEWHILNAFTRMATHGRLNDRLAQQIQTSAGRWVGDFDMVTARLPRPIAEHVGAHIIESLDDAALTGVVLN